MAVAPFDAFAAMLEPGLGGVNYPKVWAGSRCLQDKNSGCSAIPRRTPNRNDGCTWQPRLTALTPSPEAARYVIASVILPFRSVTERTHARPWATHDFIASLSLSAIHQRDRRHRQRGVDATRTQHRGAAGDVEILVVMRAAVGGRLLGSRPMMAPPNYAVVGVVRVGVLHFSCFEQARDVLQGRANFVALRT